MMTGAELVAAIRHQAKALGVPAARFAAPLSSDPDKWLRQTEIAQRPKPHTVERVRALLAGEPVTPPPANNFQKAERRGRINYATDRIDPATVPPVVDRDPCPWCGIRADIGCRHRPHSEIV